MRIMNAMYNQIMCCCCRYMCGIMLSGVRLDSVLYSG